MILFEGGSMFKGLLFSVFLLVSGFLSLSCNPFNMCTGGQVYSKELNECVEDTCIGYSCGEDQKCIVTTKGPKCECNSSQMVASEGGKCHYPCEPGNVYLSPGPQGPNQGEGCYADGCLNKNCGSASQHKICKMNQNTAVAECVCDSQSVLEGNICKPRCNPGEAYIPATNECVTDSCAGINCGDAKKCIMNPDGTHKCVCESPEYVLEDDGTCNPEFFRDVTCSDHGHVEYDGNEFRCICDNNYVNLSGDKFTCVLSSFSDFCSNGQCSNGQVITYFENRPNNGVNVFVLGEGYTRGDLGINGKFFNDAKKKIDFLFTKEPYHKFSKYFNVYIIFSESREAGIDIQCKKDGPLGLKVKVDEVNSVFDACLKDPIEYDIHRNKVKEGVTTILVRDKNRVRNYVRRAGKGDLHLAIIVANTTRYYYGTAFIGTGIGIFPADINGFDDDAVSLITYHETGHAFGLMGDEYQTGASNRAISGADRYPNLSLTDDADIIKWKDLISDYGKSDSSDYGIGTFIGSTYKGGVEGGYYRPDDVWRPMEECVMNSQFRTDKFCPVCMDTMLKRIFGIVNQNFNLNDLKHYFPKTYWGNNNHSLHDLEVFRQARELMSNEGLHVVHMHKELELIETPEIHENPVIEVK